MSKEYLDEEDVVSTFENTVLASDGKHIKFKKGTLIQKEGDLSLNVYIVKKGLLKSYVLDEIGREHVFMFAPEGWIISDLESHEFDQPAELFIECLEDCELTVIKRTNLNFAILNDEEKIKHLQLMHKRISVMQRRIIMQMSYSAKQRYEFFLNHYSNLLNRLSSKTIASFLGMIPETLSGLRSSMAKK